MNVLLRSQRFEFVDTGDRLTPPCHATSWPKLRYCAFLFETMDSLIPECKGQLHFAHCFAVASSFVGFASHWVFLHPDMAMAPFRCARSATQVLYLLYRLPTSFTVDICVRALALRSPRLCCNQESGKGRLPNDE